MADIVYILMKGCKGVCDRLPDNRPFGNAYRTHALCRRCDKWIHKQYLIDDNCPCCKRRPKLRSRKTKTEESVRIDVKAMYVV